MIGLLYPTILPFAVKRSRRIIDLQEDYRARLYEAKAPSSAIRLIDVFFQSPVVTIRAAASAIGVTYAAAASALDRLVRAGVVRELGPFKRGRMFFAEELVRRIEEDI